MWEGKNKNFKLFMLPLLLLVAILGYFKQSGEIVKYNVTWHLVLKEPMHIQQCSFLKKKA